MAPGVCSHGQLGALRWWLRGFSGMRSPAMKVYPNGRGVFSDAMLRCWRFYFSTGMTEKIGFQETKKKIKKIKSNTRVGKK